MTRICGVPLYENGRFWVAKAKNGFEVYESGITHSVRRAIIGYEGATGMAKARAEADRRASIQAGER